MLKRVTYKYMKILWRFFKRLYAYCSMIALAVFGRFRTSTVLSGENAEQLLSNLYTPESRYGRCRQRTPTKKERPILSIIIPVYNSQAYLRDCIDSVVKQECEYEYELICVNDGSTDASGAILEFYANLPNVIIISQNNSGISAARNRGMQEASGKYVMFIDNDDLLAPGFLNLMLRNALTSDADIVKCGYQILKNGVLERKSIEMEDGVLFGDRIKDIFRLNGYCWGMLIRWELIDDFAFPLGFWYEDMVTRLVLYAKCKKLCYVAQPLYRYRIHNSNASATVWKEKNKKVLDQLYLASDCLRMALERGDRLSPEACLAYQYELGIMLRLRTLQQEQRTREALFLCACQLHDEIELHCGDYATNGKLHEKLIFRALHTRDFQKWDKLCQYGLTVM